MAIPRLIRNAVTRQIMHTGSSASGSSNSNTRSRYSPQYILSQLFIDQPSSSKQLTVKRSLKQHGRFFMYEESHDVTNIITVSPNELSALLQQQQQQSTTNNRDRDTTKTTTEAADYHYYWTAPIKSVAPASLLDDEFQWYKQLYNNNDNDNELLDPRGPSLWMGTSGSGTQCKFFCCFCITPFSPPVCRHFIFSCLDTPNVSMFLATCCIGHYDVANNIIVQLYGTKRIRCYPPSMGIYNLHVFPDAHPKARKSQVDFDIIDDDDVHKERFPHYYYNENIPKPTLDVILQPGDALEIPAFTFHHVENGHIPNAKEEEEDDDENNGHVDLPSVSLNSFALSKPMMIAQGIFQKASRPMGRNVTTEDVQLYAPSILRALGISLIQQLDIDNTAGKEVEFIRKYLLEARYSPLMDSIDGNSPTTTASIRRKTSNEMHTQKVLTNEQLQTINSCIERIIPDFHLLIDKEDHGEGSNSIHHDDGKGIVLLVAFHLMELWAVELVGAESVASAWDDALS